MTKYLEARNRKGITPRSPVPALFCLSEADGERRRALRIRDFGATKLNARTGTNQYSEAQRVTVAYDPLNPGQSKVVSEPRTPAA